MLSIFTYATFLSCVRLSLWDIFSITEIQCYSVIEAFQWGIIFIGAATLGLKYKKENVTVGDKSLT